MSVVSAIVLLSKLSDWILLGLRSHFIQIVAKNLFVIKVFPDNPFKTPHPALPVLLLGFISIMFISFRLSVYFTYYFIITSFPQLDVHKSGLDLSLFWSTTYSLKNHVPLSKYTDVSKIEATLPNPCYIQVMSFNKFSAMEYE